MKDFDRKISFTMSIIPYRNDMSSIMVSKLGDGFSSIE